MNDFEFNSNPAHVIFGSGTITRLRGEVERLGASSPLIVCTAGQAKNAARLESILGGHVAGIFAEAAMHTPKNVTEKALAVAQHHRADAVISIGGGSSVGLGKALAVNMGFPHLCIPTSYAGSEMTAVLGETADGVKTTRSDPKIIPTAVLYDVDLTMSLPATTSAASGINAIAHAVEALYAQKTNPVISMYALEGVKTLAEALPAIVADPSSRNARTQALYGAWLCSLCLGTVSMALHHKLCHTLGGSFGLPHAETHTIVLPHALAYNAPAVPEAMQKLASVLPDSDGDAAQGLNKLLNRLKVKRALSDFGMKEEDIDKAAEIATTNAYWNPRPLEKTKLREVIRRAWAGEDARPDL